MKRFAALFVTIILLLSSACAESATAALQELYAQGELLMVQGDYAGAAAKFEALGTYSDASQMAMYCKAIAAAETLGLYSMAVDAFNDLGDFKDSRQMAKYYDGRRYEAGGVIEVATASDSALDQALWALEEAEKVYGGLAFFKDSLTRYGACGERIKEIKSEQSRRAAEKKEATYQQALTLEQSGDYAGAIKLYQNIKGYKDSTERIQICQTAILDGKYDAALALMEAGKYSEAITAFKAIKTHRDSAKKIKECETAILDGKYDAAVALMEAGKYSEAITAFKAIKTHRDSAEKIKECETAILDGKYNAALALMEEGKYSEAITAFNAIKNHKDSVKKIEECENAILDGKYDAAVALMNEGKYIEAITAFKEIKEHRDSATKITECKDAALYNADVGDFIIFGLFEQDDNTTNGKEDIEWLVLAKEKNRLLVISRCSLYSEPYETVKEEATWETCWPRKLLNDYFFEQAFSDTEKAIIPTVTVTADKNPKYKANPGKATKDKVFLLSIVEAEKYFQTDSERQCKSIKGYACSWWLRSPGNNDGWDVDLAAVVREAGDIYYHGHIVNNKRWGSSINRGVRPALWIDLATDADHEAATSIVITANSAKIRTEASISAGLVKTAYKGESFTLLGESGDFYQISVNGKTGYVHKDVCKIK